MMKEEMEEKGQEFDIDDVASKSGRKKIEAPIANIKNSSDESPNGVACDEYN
jgi:hypothetical protein